MRQDEGTGVIPICCILMSLASLARSRRQYVQGINSPALALTRSMRGAKSGTFPDFVEPSLATLAARSPKGDKWLHEIKYDGYRFQCLNSTEVVDLDFPLVEFSRGIRRVRSAARGSPLLKPRTSLRWKVKNNTLRLVSLAAKARQVRLL